MQKSKNQNKKQIIVYILGAGASAADGAPLTKKLVLNTCLNFWSQPQRRETLLSEFRPVLKEMDKMFGTNLEDVFVKANSPGRLTGNWADAYYKIDVEKFLTQITNMSKKNEKFKKQAYYFIFHPLCYETNLMGRLRHYTAFVENVLKEGTRHCIITFNYDVLLERAMCEKSLPWTYAVDFTDVLGIPRYAKDESIAEIFVLKLHGSFNWGLCPSTDKVTIYAPAQDIQMYERLYNAERKCHSGGHVCQPLIIPPTREKELNIPALQQVWEKAKCFLRQATELHIIGYSAPEADEDAQNLLKKMKPRVSELEKVILANRSANNRIKELLGITNSKKYDNYREYDTFKDYLECEFSAELE